MMLSLRKPSAEAIRHFLVAQAKLDYSYSAVGAQAGGDVQNVAVKSNIALQSDHHTTSPLTGLTLGNTCGN